ncbi:unnamed protein product [Didymodactylos carnosus]|uniref:Uncharacterized protein n=1 Tax=Didymodactylos carnosus TaxID=1234261 RepID=A0A8S2E8K2_9BILA|nr:unnamed protein product [Didymodactylos carnosus]CAF3844041.1 unnamed protein product [Didymodactylos carnosus]
MTDIGSNLALAQIRQHQQVRPIPQVPPVQLHHENSTTSTSATDTTGTISAASLTSLTSSTSTHPHQLVLRASKSSDGINLVLLLAVGRESAENKKQSACYGEQYINDGSKDQQQQERILSSPDPLASTLLSRFAFHFLSTRILACFPRPSWFQSRHDSHQKSPKNLEELPPLKLPLPSEIDRLSVPTPSTLSWNYTDPSRTSRQSLIQLKRSSSVSPISEEYLSAYRSSSRLPSTLYCNSVLAHSYLAQENLKMNA